MSKLGRTIALLTAISSAGTAVAQDWPTRPVTMIVGQAAGGAADAMGRLFAQKMAERLHQQMVVENVSGAGGLTAAYRIAKAPPDGYQFVLGASGNFAIAQTLSKKPLFESPNDFAPVALVTVQPNVLLMRKDFPANTPQEFIAYAKANPGKIKFGSPGHGTTTHLACALFNAAIGIETTHVPYRSGMQAIQDLLAGHIDYACSFVPSAQPQIDANTLKAVAVLSSKRSPMLPTVPSAVELGLADFDADAWSAFFLPKGTPPGIVQKLHDATVFAMDDPTVQAKLHALGATVVAPERRSPEYLRQFVVDEIVKWAGVMKSAGITPE